MALTKCTQCKRIIYNYVLKSRGEKIPDRIGFQDYF